MIKTIKIETAASRAILVIAGLFCLATGFFFLKWCFANVIAAQSPSKEVAELSVGLSPNDPQTHYALAVLNEKTFLPEDLPKSAAEFERATALSPHDFQLWLALGKARERNGDAAGAELALKKASELAPHYAQIRWTLGNVLLRRGKIEEAFTEIRRAAQSDAAYRIPAVSVAWQIFDGDTRLVKQSIGDTAMMNSVLAAFLAKQNRFDEAFQMWNALPAEEKRTTLKANGEELFTQAIAEKKYRAAWQIQIDLEEKPDAENFAVGKVFNGGFETDVKREKASPFDWQIADGAQPQIGFDDALKNGGKRSLVIIYNSSDGKEYRQISQIAVVESGKEYVFGMFYKSELKTAATFRWEIADAADGKILAATEPVSNAANWTNLKARFTAPPNMQAVVIKLTRENCKSSVCPIAGKLWFDDFSIN